MYELHYDYIKNKYGNISRLLFANSDSLIYEIKTEDVYKNFSDDREMFNLSSYLIKSKYYDNSNKLVLGKMKDETAGVVIEEFVGLEQKIYSHLIGDNSEHNKTKGVNRNIVETIIHNEYKDVLLNKKCLRHSINWIQSKDHKIGTYEINRIPLSCFRDKIYIQNNGCDGLAFGYQS